MAVAGGFTRFRRASQTPFNLVFEVRPAKVLAFAKGRFGQTRYRFS